MKKVLAIVLTLVIALSCALILSSCGTKDTEQTTAAETPATPAAGADETAEPAEPDISAQDVTAAEETTAEETTIEETTVEETTVPAPSAPSTTQEILDFYNEAVNKVADEKAGFSKSRTTNVNRIEGGAVLKLKIAKDAVMDFLGQGTNTYNNTKGQKGKIGTASLKSSDVKSAELTESDGKYTIKISVNNGSSHADNGGKSDSSPLKRSGLYVGDTDESAFDYKSANNIHYALNHTDGAAVEVCDLNTSNGKITAVIDPETKEIESLDVSFNFDVVMQNVKYTIARVKSGDGDATTTVSFSDFKY